MSSLEKNTVRNVKVSSNVKERPPVKSRAYKGLSTVNSDNTSYALYDIGLIKQD